MLHEIFSYNCQDQLMSITAAYSLTLIKISKHNGINMIQAAYNFTHSPCRIVSMKNNVRKRLQINEKYHIL